MKKLMIILMAVIPMLSMAQEKLNVKVDSVGKLASKISIDQKFKIADLTVSGTLNGTDLKLLQEIVNRLVSVIDLSGVTIVEGKEGMKTKANELPKGMFSGAKQLVKAVLPSSIQEVSENCFAGCENLADVTIPASVTTIKDEAFQGCERLASITLPSGLKTIESEAFEDCKSLVSITLPSGINKIAVQAFNV